MLITGDWGLVAETGATTVGKTAVDVVTIGRDWNKNTHQSNTVRCYRKIINSKVG